MKVAAYTLGCKVNQYETEAVLDEFKKGGFFVVPFEEKADVYIINTCSVTAQSDKKSGQMIRRARRNNKDAVVAVCGCYTQGKNDLESMKDGDILMGTANKMELPQKVFEFLNNKQRVVSKIDLTNETKIEKMSVIKSNSKTRGFIKIEDGCENFCAYCIIPYVRGKIRSKPMDEVLEEIKALADNGYHEIVLTGIHLCSYGKEFTYDLTDLIEKIGEIKEIKRLRLGSLEPTFINEKNIERLKKVVSLCPHFHLSLQSGCDETLKRMKRKYITADYEKEVNLLRAAFDDPSISTDIMVGFPNETDEEFEESKAFFDKMKFSQAHIFMYSRREGTAADKMEGQIDETIKQKRSKVLMEIAKENRIEFFKKYIGKTVRALFESQMGNNIFEGYTKNYVPIRIFSEKDLKNSFINVKIKSVNENYCEAEIWEEVK
jgi:threonylcarbamoyladenosine tRNA methylthiotransferase MtaB